MSCIALSKKHPVCFALQIGGPAGQPCRGGPAGRIKMPGFSCRAAGSDRPGGQASRTRSTGRADRANGWPTGRADRPGRLAGSRGRAQHYENLDPRAALYIMKQFVNVSVVFIMLGTTKFIMFRGARGVWHWTPRPDTTPRARTPEHETPLPLPRPTPPKGCRAARPVDRLPI